MRLRLHRSWPRWGPPSTPIRSPSRAPRRHRTSVNLIHLATNIKVDLFVVGGDGPGVIQIQRHQPRQLSEDPASVVFFHSHEDILLQKLQWYRAGGEVSDRQWRDVLAVARVRGKGLDRDYLSRQARVMGVADLLGRLMSAAGLT